MSCYLAVYKENILGKDSFETFLNKKKHTLVHLYETLPCCECIVSKKINGERLVSRKQFLVLYKSIDRNKVYYHNKYACRKLTQICTCNYSANDNVDVKVVDIILANYIIKRCGKREQGVDNWIEQIKDVRNKIFHLSDIQKITDHKFNRIWTQLEGSILGIANLMGSVYVDEIEKKILQTKEHIFISSYMLKYEKLCCDYWRNKCAEFERAQIQVFEKKTEALHMKDPKVFSKSMEKDCQKTMEEIQGTSQINSDDEHDQAEKADHPSAIHDCKTRTEFDESVRFKSYFQFDISRRLRLQIEPIQNSLISDCVIKNDHLVFTDYFNNILHIYNINGSHYRTIRLSNHPKCIAVIKENDVAVSFNRDIEIIDINTEQVKNTIVTRGVTSGISYQNKLMYVVIGHRTIDVMKITGEIFRSIHCPFQSLHIGLSTDTDSLFLTDPLTLTVYCCDLYGSVRWKFSNVKMPMPTGVTTDDNGNVYIVCNKSNNVVVVSPDGKHHKELLTEKDGLQKPTGIYYDKSNDCLLGGARPKIVKIQKLSHSEFENRRSLANQHNTREITTRILRLIWNRHISLQQKHTKKNPEGLTCLKTTT
ncbi:unnamed protein product [Mytilus edulis]|uniref:Lambda-carrageenase beta-propeller domain-containing protein n=1 Tax=Mytilus edulis TaxID=6550 RepID=A0A8S3RGB9_MYTED|nr:unnamed protein product [Mytilus edulis]